jgi:L-aspartate oxidase
MTAGAGSVRSAASLAATAARLAKRAEANDGGKCGPRNWETTNLLHLGQALTLAATLREETRGGHVREDFPQRDDENFLHRRMIRREDDGVLTSWAEPVPHENLVGLDLDGPLHHEESDERLP